MIARGNILAIVMAFCCMSVASHPQRRHHGRHHASETITSNHHRHQHGGQRTRETACNLQCRGNTQHTAYREFQFHLLSLDVNGILHDLACRGDGCGNTLISTIARDAPTINIQPTSPSDTLEDGITIHLLKFFVNISCIRTQLTQLSSDLVLGEDDSLHGRTNGLLNSLTALLCRHYNSVMASQVCIPPHCSSTTSGDFYIAYIRVLVQFREFLSSVLQLMR